MARLWVSDSLPPGAELSIDTIVADAQRAGYSRGIVNERFGTKQALIERLVEDMQQRILDALLALVDAYLARGEDIGRAFYVLMAESIGPVPELRATFARANREFRDFVEREIHDGIEAGDIRPDVDPPAQAALVVSSLRGLTLQRLVDPSGVDTDTTRRQLLGNLERTLRHRQE